jgi:Protein of unknown function (DUF2911)
MTRYLAYLLAFAAILTGTAVPAQQKKLLSPRDSVSITLDTNTVSMNYGRPSMRGRVIMGGLVPWNAVWRTGANEATHLRTNFDMMLGTVPVTRGRYTLWTIPNPDEWTIIVNKETGQWGTKYHEALDLARFTVPVQLLDSAVDMFTISMSQTGPAAGEIALEWEKTRVVIPFQKNDAIRPLSPADSAQTTVGSATVKIVYSQPHKRGRAIWGIVVPFDSVWRTGANSATRLETDHDITIAGTTVPAGKYTLYSIPRKDTLELVVSKVPGGEASYNPTMDLARVSLAASPVSPEIERFTISFAGETGTSVMLQLAWGDRMYSAKVSTP